MAKKFRNGGGSSKKGNSGSQKRGACDAKTILQEFKGTRIYSDVCGIIRSVKCEVTGLVPAKGEAVRITVFQEHTGRSANITVPSTGVVKGPNVRKTLLDSLSKAKARPMGGRSPR